MGQLTSKWKSTVGTAAAESLFELKMNVDVYARIRAPVHGEGQHTLLIDKNHRIVSGPGTASFTFQCLHQPEATNHEVFQKTVEPLVDLCIAGYNTCLMLVGESGSGKSASVIGDHLSKAGLAEIILEHLFSKIQADDRYMFDEQVRRGQPVQMEIYEIYNELVRDLSVSPTVQPEYLQVTESPERGPYVKGGQISAVGSSTDGLSLFRQAWSRRTEKLTDFGPARNHTALLVHLHLDLKSRDSPLPNKSRFSIVLVPGIEKLSEDSQQLRLQEGLTLSKSLAALSQLAATLANQQYPDRHINYTESKLTFLLRDELGGNCKTRVLFCFKPQPSSSLLNTALLLANQFASVQNYPILNDPFAQNLITLYRSEVIYLKQQLGYHPGMPTDTSVSNVPEQLQRLQTENIQLRDHNERLHDKLDQLQGKFGALASTKTDLSAQLLLTEEEKLKVSKTLVEMQIDNNKLKEECEAAKFELTNKILQLESQLMELGLEKDKHAKAATNTREKLTTLEEDRKQLASDYIAMKAENHALSEANKQEVMRNEELSVELLNLVNAKAAMMRQMQNKLAHGRTSPNSEIDRVKNLIGLQSSRRQKDGMVSDRDRENLHQKVFGSQLQLEDEMRELQGQHDVDQRRLADKLLALKDDVQYARNKTRDKQRTVSELNAQLITLRSSHDQLQTLNNRMQHKLKDINDEFRSRLVKYVQDIADYIDKKKSPEKNLSTSDMRLYVDEMLSDMKKAHRVREEQLSNAAQTYRKQLTETVHKHEGLLVAYSQLRHQVLEHDLDIDLGPTEGELQLNDLDLASTQQKEITRLRDEIAQAHDQIETLKLKIRMNGVGGHSERDVQVNAPSTSDAGKAENWSNLRRRLREFTVGTQQELERERAQLLTRVHILEEENKELHDYIDNHLARYKEEIKNLQGASKLAAAAAAKPAKMKALKGVGNNRTTNPSNLRSLQQTDAEDPKKVIIL